MVIVIRNKVRRRTKEIFLLSPHRRNSKVGDVARKFNRIKLPRTALKFKTCGSKIALDAHIQELKT